MSRSNPNNDLQSPVTKKFEWSGSEGKIKSYDAESKTNEFFDLPFTFLVLDKLATIAGFSDSDNSGFWSNEVRNTKTDLLCVRTKKGIEQEALYQDLEPTLNKGAKFAQSVYIAFYEGSELKIGNLKIFGSALGSWIDFTKNADIYKNAITIVDAKPEKKGATKYFVPVYQAKEVSDETNKKAALLDVEVQAYLTNYPSRQGKPTEKASYSAPINQMTPNKDAEKVSHETKTTTANASAPSDDLPF